MNLVFKSGMLNPTSALKGFQIACTALGLAALVSCSSQPVDQNNPESVFRDAESDVSSDRFQMAHEKFSKIRHRFPYSRFAILAQLRIADVYFKEESFQEAANSYQLFLELHPNHEQAPYAAFQAGESYFLDAPENVARDMSSAHRSLQAFQSFLTKYPSDEKAAVARERLTEIRDRLAEKELYIGNFYHIRQKPAAAKARFERLKTLYPESKHITEADDKRREDEDRIRELEEKRRASEDESSGT